MDADGGRLRGAGMTIGYLADHARFLPQLADWHHREWSYLRPGDTIEARTGRLRSACGRRAIPTVLVAFSGEELLGSAMLVTNDMDSRMDLSPWIAGVFVRADRRGLGIGTQLMTSAVEEARLLGVGRLYLYTPGAEGFYAGLGWKVIDRPQYRGVGVAVMTRGVAWRAADGRART